MSIYITSHNQLEKGIYAAEKSETPLMVHGHPGIGKSFTFWKAAKRLAKEQGLEFSDNPSDINDKKKYVFIVLNMHQFDLAEIKGLPYPSEDGTYIKFLPTELLPREGQGMILLDELNLAVPTVQANCYQIVNEKRIGAYKIPDGYSVFAAGNLSEDRAHTFDMPAPLNNRLRHAQLAVPSSEDWIKNYAVPAGLDHRVISFIASRDDMLYKFVGDEDEISFPTPRTWDILSKSIKGYEDEDMLEFAACTSVGVATGTQFVAHVKMAMEFDIAKVFETETLPVDVKNSEPSVVYALISSIVSFYKKKSAKDDGKAAKSVLMLSQQFSKEHEIMVLSLARAVNEKFFDILQSIDEEATFKACKKIAPYLL